MKVALDEFYDADFYAPHLPGMTKSSNIQIGYECYGIVRPMIWNDTQVEGRHKKSTFLACRSNTQAINTQALKQAEKPIIDVAHPETLAERTLQIARKMHYPTLSCCTEVFKHRVLNKLSVKATVATAKSSITLFLSRLISTGIEPGALLAVATTSA